jgi:hypothetical protein
MQLDQGYVIAETDFFEGRGLARLAGCARGSSRVIRTHQSLSLPGSGPSLQQLLWQKPAITGLRHGSAEYIGISGSVVGFLERDADRSSLLSRRTVIVSNKLQDVWTSRSIKTIQATRPIA